MDKTTQLDQDAVNLTKAIRQIESGSNFTSQGKSGEYGAYQFTEPTWDATSKKYGVSIPLKNATPEQQNEVAYKQVKEWKDKGFNVGEIASMWNAGSGRPKAYLENNVGENKYGVHYDTPTYAKNVATEYHKLKGTQPVTPQPEVKPTDNRDFLQKAGDVVNSIFPGKQIGQAIGTLGGYVASPNKEFYDTSAPTPLQVAGDVGQAALTVAPGLGPVKAFGKVIPGLKTAATIGGRIGQSGLLGAGIGATGAIKEGSTDISQIAKEGLKGGLIGGALGGVGESLSAISNHFPKTMIQGKFEGLTDAEANKFLSQKIGTQETLLKNAQKVVENEGNKIDEVLKKFVPKEVSTANPFVDTLQQFPEFQGREGQLVNKIKSFVSNSSNIGEERSTILKYIDKIINGEATLFEKNQVRKVLDLSTKGGYAKLAKAIAPSAGHDLAMTFADSLRNEIQSTVKETIPMFKELQKSLNIRSAVMKATKKKGATALLKYADIIPFLGGNTLAPGIGGVGAVLANRAVENPATRFAASKISKGILNGAGKVIKSPIAVKGIEGLFGGNVNVKQ